VKVDERREHIATIAAELLDYALREWGPDGEVVMDAYAR
jgi:hypothetical protein